MPLVFYGKVGEVLGHTFRPCRSVCFPHFPGKERRTIFSGNLYPLEAKRGLDTKFLGETLTQFSRKIKLYPCLICGGHSVPKWNLGTTWNPFFWISQQKKEDEKNPFSTKCKRSSNNVVMHDMRCALKRHYNIYQTFFWKNIHFFPCSKGMMIL